MEPTAAQAAALDPLEHLEHLDVSLQDFESSPGSPSPFGYPSAHSGFRSSSAGAESSETAASSEATASTGGYSPPAWRRLGNGDRSSGFWRKSNPNHSHLDGRGFGGFNLGGHQARGLSPEYDNDESDGGGDDDRHDDSSDDGGDDEALEQAIRTRLPTGSLSPEKERSPEPEYVQRLAQIKRESDDEDKSTITGPKDLAENYIRFAVRAEVQQRTAPIEATVTSIRRASATITKSYSSMALSAVVAILAYAMLRALLAPASQRPVPDLVKVAGIARSFEPLIYYSENGVQQVGDLQATGVAVWDLSESVRSSNMTSAPIIVKELDELSDSLKTLAIELTKFFANVDGDIDGILIVMDWARRELGQVLHLPSPPLSSVFDNIHNMLSSAGVLENAATGEPTRLGAVATSLFGMSNPQRTRQTLQRTFNEFLAVLEEAIASELQHSLALFGLFEAIDRQFLNLGRTVVRESSVQEERHADLLSSLWTRILGPKASDVSKFERNRLLLQNVREKTVRNKGILVEHNHRLLALKANLENLRRKLVSPLVRSVNSSTLSTEEQIRGLEDVGLYLDGVRTRQKGKLMELLYGSSRHAGAVGADSGRAIDTKGRAAGSASPGAGWG